jgi:hypothetical protein
MCARYTDISSVIVSRLESYDMSDSSSFNERVYDDAVKEKRWSIIVAIAAASAWSITFLLAFSDCSVQSTLRFECTELSWGKATATIGDAEKIGALKGQFGDLFGILNGAFGAVTLFFVYRAFGFERTASVAQIELVRLERYYAEVDTSILSYNRLLRDVLIPARDKDGKTLDRWPGAHGLYHL